MNIFYNFIYADFLVHFKDLLKFKKNLASATFLSKIKTDAWKKFSVYPYFSKEDQEYQ